MQQIVPFLAVALTACGVAAGADAWPPVAEPISAFGNLSFSVPPPAGKSILIRIETPDGRQAVQLDVGGRRGRLRLEPDTTFSPAVREGTRFYPESLRTRGTNAAPLILKFREEAWSLYCQDHCLAVIPSPFPLPAVVKQPVTDRPAESPATAHFQKVADFRFEDSFMRPEESENPLGEWEPISGDWALHAPQALTIKGESAKLDGKRTLKSDFSPNFYSLAGKGAPAMITAGYDFYDDYALEAGVRVGMGEMGLLFYASESGAAHAFTLTMDEDDEDALLTLWSQDSTTGTRRVLAAATINLTAGQWVKLSVQVMQNGVRCYLDQAKVFDLTADLPAGGRFGLYANGPEEARFDDVTVQSCHDLEWANVGELRRAVLDEHGVFLPRRRFFQRSAPGAEATALTPAVSPQPQWLTLGSTAHGPHVFEATFEPTALPFTVGVLAGYRGASEPYYRFTCRRTDIDETFQLERVEAGSATPIEPELRLPLKAGETNSGRVTLMFDASREKEWRLYRNGAMVMVHVPAPAEIGASGLYVGENTRVRIPMPRYRFARDDLFVNRYEKNNRFAKDPFMRHWASPEGQWLTETNGLTWYTGDFFGRFSLRMPLVTPSEIHLGVDENATQGVAIVSVDTNGIRFLCGGSAGAKAPEPIMAATNGLTAGKRGNETYTVQHEGYWVWITSGDRLLAKQRLDKPLAGRRIRVSGFTTEQLKGAYVERFNVKDFLFTESLFDWIINGGRWEVVNRFQCDPRWSHMNGENTNGLAALWTKLEIGGDFCVEMHAGQRMGWYDRCGDMNLTVMNHATTPNEGYSIVCTGWDPDHSQRFTTLYRNGEVLARSEKYLVPRKREGNKRLGYEPLILAGRDVHGAWYYLKFRRIGKKLELFFDNELVFTAVDEQPLEGGTAGIWTFLNSIMVARVKVAAESIRYRLPEIRPVSLESAAEGATHATVPASSAGSAALLNHGQPLRLMQPAYWEADDPVGRLRLMWGDTPDAGPSFTARNRMGSGNMMTACSLPPMPLPDLAGWRFQVKRTPNAQFDFQFSVGRLGTNGIYMPERQFLHRLSGPASYKDGAVVMCGETAVAGDGWTSVTVWIPRDGFADPGNRSRAVKVEGFGLFQPSFELQGLSGNQPGEEYAVRDFTAITYAPFRLSLDTNGAIPATFAALDPASGLTLGTFGSVTGIEAWVNAYPSEGINCGIVQSSGAGGKTVMPLTWIRLPAKPAIACSWHDRKPDTVVLYGERTYPDPRFLQAKASIGEAKPVWTAENFFTRSAAVPQQQAFASERVPVTIGDDMDHFLRAWKENPSQDAPPPMRLSRFSLDWKENPRRGVPVLLGLVGLTPFLQNGETRDTLSGIPAANPQCLQIADCDPEQSRYFRVMNTRQSKRLRCAIPAALSLARYPFFQFRYRTTDPMTRVSLGLGNARFARISEESGLPVRQATNLAKDGAWHTWMGQVSDAIDGGAFSRTVFLAKSPEIVSAHLVDQTGLFSRWDLDDLVFGPAVSSAAQLAFTPNYFDFGGVASVFMAIRSGPEPYDPVAPTQAMALAWREIKNGAEAVPNLDGLADGPCHLLLKARGQSGRESQVTDIPFLVDRKPLRGSAAFADSSNGIPVSADLRVTWDSDGAAPLDPETLALKWDGEEVNKAMTGIRLLREGQRDTLSLNWAYYFRDQLSKTTNGHQATILFTGVQDGAGNQSPDVSVSVSIDYATDHAPPSLLAARYPTNVFWRTTWDTPTNQALGFTARPGAVVALVRTTNEAPYLQVSGTNGVILAAVNRSDWRVQAYPYLALRIRRPALPSTHATTALSLAIEFSTTNTILVPLVAQESQAGQYNLPDPIEWRSNEWASVFLDLTDVVKDRIPTQNLAGLTVKSLTLRHTAPPDAAQFQLQSVFAYAPGSPADRVQLDAYDVSGLDRTAVEYETSDGRLMEAAAFFGSSEASRRPPRGWVLLKTRDKAGNVAEPVRFPIWSNAPFAGDP